MSTSTHARDDRRQKSRTGGDKASSSKARNTGDKPSKDSKPESPAATSTDIPGNQATSGSPNSDSANPDSATTGYFVHRPPAGEPTDEQLVQQHRDGDEGSFRRLVERYQRELYHFLVRFLGDRAAAEDVFQEAFLQVHQSAWDFDVQRRFRPWLFTIAANKARDLIRSQARRPTNPLQAAISPGDNESGEFIDLMESAAAMPDEPLQLVELQAQVRQAVMNMPDNLREILLLSYFHQFPYKQIGEILEIPLGTVKSRLHSAVAFFADKWKTANKTARSA